MTAITLRSPWLSVLLLSSTYANRSTTKMAPSSNLPVSSPLRAAGFAYTCCMPTSSSACDPAARWLSDQGTSFGSLPEMELPRGSSANVVTPAHATKTKARAIVCSLICVSSYIRLDRASPRDLQPQRNGRSDDETTPKTSTLISPLGASARC